MWYTVRLHRKTFETDEHDDNGEDKLNMHELLKHGPNNPIIHES